ncbi:MAG: GIY-YIG nuclease family protein [Candidatus Moraniibacteriota bacterium]
MAYAYILQDKMSNRYYIGSCLEISVRLARHQHHTGGRTTRKGEWHLVCYKTCKSILEARRIEKLVKSYKGGNAFKAIVSGTKEEWRGGRVA